MKIQSRSSISAIAMAALLIAPTFAHAGSIQIMEPSTSKIPVIGSKNTPSIEKLGKETPARPGKKSMPVKTATPVVAAPTAPVMRTGEAELPLVEVSKIKSK